MPFLPPNQQRQSTEGSFDQTGEIYQLAKLQCDLFSEPVGSASVQSFITPMKAMQCNHLNDELI